LKKEKVSLKMGVNLKIPGKGYRLGARFWVVGCWKEYATKRDRFHQKSLK